MSVKNRGIDEDDGSKEEGGTSRADNETHIYFRACPIRLPTHFTAVSIECPKQETTPARTVSSA